MIYPKITLITPTFNSEKHIRKTIDSIISQNYPNLEYIVVDDMSNDNTINIIKEYGNFVNNLIIEKDKNSFDAINKGIKKSTGELIKIINSDDYLLENCLFEAAEVYSNSDDKQVVVDGYLKAIWEDGSFKAIWTNKQKIINNYDIFNHPSWFVPKIIYDKFGLYSIDYNICSDYEYYLRLKSAGIPFLTIENPIVAFRMGGISYGLDSLPEIKKINLAYFPFLKAYSNYLNIAFLKFLRKYYHILRVFFRIKL